MLKISIILLHLILSNHKATYVTDYKPCCQHGHASFYQIQIRFQLELCQLCLCVIILIMSLWLIISAATHLTNMWCDVCQSEFEVYGVQRVTVH